MSTTVVTTAASVTKLITAPPNIISSAVTNAVLHNQDVSKTIISELQYGFNYAVGTEYYNYGFNSFVNGLPAGGMTFTLPDDAYDLYLEAINKEMTFDGGAVATAVVSHNIGYPNTLQLIGEFFQNNSTEWVLSIFGFTLVEVATGDQYTIKEKVFTNGNIHLVVVKYEGTTEVVFDIPVNLNTNSNVLQVVFTTDEPIVVFPKKYYWTYVPNTRRHRDLDFLADMLGITEYFPIAPSRLDNENVADMLEDGEPSTLTRSTQQLLKKLNIKLGKFTADLVDPEDPTAIDDVDNGYVLFAINLDSEEDIAIAYLYEFFKRLYAIQMYDQQHWIDLINNFGVDLNGTSQNTLGLSDGRFNARIQFNFITLEVKNGLIGDPQSAYDPMVLVPHTGSPIDADNNGVGEYSKTVIIGSEYTTQVAGITFFITTMCSLYVNNLLLDLVLLLLN